MRVSTTQMFRNGISTMQQNQQALSNTQLQLSTGKRILKPSDDPSGSVQSLQFRSAIQQTEQYQRNGGMAEQRLSLSETTLSAVGEGLHRVRELAIQGNNATQTDDTRKFIAGEIRQILDELMQLANTRDANGEFIYAGVTSLTQPFSTGSGGEVIYNGDDGQRQVQLSPVRQVAVGNSGQEVFMDIPTGNGVFTVHDSAGNTGTGVVDAGSVLDASAWDPDDYTLSFDFNSEGELVYQVTRLDTNGDVVVVVPESGDADWDEAPQFVAGQAIQFNGIELRVSGTPAVGDSFAVVPSQNQDMFSTFRQLAEALEAPVESDADRATLNNAVNRALQDLDNALGNVLDIRAGVGARLKAVESQRAINEDVLLQLKTTLSEVEDLDYAEAISRFNMQQTTLQAAQQTYVQVQRLSLFNFL
ncbi:flagellar hook-associated protein 3 [Thioalkalivibrio denitrificans]|uniref:Flagellar hook-associated protein 3 n=1 Tax=Thioalkalivibrio denitrificans TaxID=108003 RepID=A0A1V3NQ47_9GAMM|nr:flagellar hook-associated protein FlgL [Thioalkalivibrio denitrificans]OOG27124.1 flagellar hook-associated protein 3 [Thioalkalivibrio denitrificans]